MKPTISTLSPEMLIGQADFVGALSRSLLADPHAADDVAQETLLAALEAPPAEAGALRGWLARVARNFALQRGRGERRRTAREHGAARPERIPSTADVLERESARAAVVRAVLELDEPYRTAILLRFYEGRAPREIAELLELPIDTVHTRTKRALAMLRARLDREFGSRAAWAALLVPFTRFPLVPTAEGASAPSAPSSFQRKPTMKLSLELAAVGLALVGGAAYWLMPASDSRAGSTSVAEASASPAVSPARAETPRSEPAPAAPRREALSTSAPLDAGTVTPTPPSVARATSGSLRLTLTWSDDTPAADVQLSVVDVGRASYEALSGVSDANGVCTLTGLRAGKAWVTLDRKSHWDKADIVGGEETALALQLPRGFDVEGVVVDANQAPVAGAAVWLGEPVTGGPESYFRVATSAADGSFTLRSCRRNAMLWARADGQAPSWWRMVDGAQGTSVSVTLDLGGAGASVTGRVLDPEGQPVEGALVLVDGQLVGHAESGTAANGMAFKVMSLKHSHAGPTSTRTDADGRFAVAGVTPGTVPLGVLAPGFAAWRGSVAAAAGQNGDAEITLAAGFRLTGTVHDADDHPVAGRVWVYAAAGSLQLSPMVMTDADGSFEIDGLPPGAVRVVADSGEGEAWKSLTHQAETTLTGTVGAELSWDVVLAAELTQVDIPYEDAPWGE